MKKICLFIIVISLIYRVQAQSIAHPIVTATPFLSIVPDARSGAMGNVGVATSSDAYALFHNASKMTFQEHQISIGVSYTPWLRNLTSGFFVGSAAYTNRFKENQAWGAELKFFSLGKIELTDISGVPQGYENPNEFSLSGAYSLKLSKTFSMAVGTKYIRSNLDIGDDLNPINSFAVDISGYYQSLIKSYGTFDGRYRIGFNIANIGPKVSYTPGRKLFIPTNLKLGGGFDFILDNFNTFGLTFQFTKLLVPSNSKSDKGWISSIFSSFGDAPGGLSEELKEITYALGAEYLYNKDFALRAGYFHESEFKGNQQFFTIGAGFKARTFLLDLSYLINTSNVNNPLENTLRLSIEFNMGEIYSRL